ncbi:MAG: hypothetical protein JXR63_06095 [Spirochaetales bacterium]|nr:hypothetical protein [Spirochaetales bacterium]
MKKIVLCLFCFCSSVVFSGDFLLHHCYDNSVYGARGLSEGYGAPEIMIGYYDNFYYQFLDDFMIDPLYPVQLEGSTKNNYKVSDIEFIEVGDDLIVSYYYYKKNRVYLYRVSNSSCTRMIDLEDQIYKNLAAKVPNIDQLLEKEEHYQRWANKIVYSFAKRDSNLIIHCGIKSNLTKNSIYAEYQTLMILNSYVINSDLTLKEFPFEENPFRMEEVSFYFIEQREYLDVVENFTLQTPGKFGLREDMIFTRETVVYNNNVLKLLDNFFSFLYSSNFLLVGCELISGFTDKFNRTEGLSFRSSSFLKEGATLYNVENLKKDDIPWVEGVAGHGIGEWIEIKSEKDINILHLYNGFYDEKRPELYKNNSRVKKVRIESLDKSFKMFVYLKDSPGMQNLYIPVKGVRSLKIYIEEVYPGAKWSDTCINRICFS